MEYTPTRDSKTRESRKKLEDAVVAATPVRIGDRLIVQGVTVGLDDLSSVSKPYVVVKNSRTDEEIELAIDRYVYDDHASAEDNIGLLYDYLFPGQAEQDEPVPPAGRELAIKLLKDAGLIGADYKEGT